MKRIKLFLSMLVAAVLLPTGVWAQQSYNFKFCEVEVNASNCSDIPVAGMTGKASYEDATNTLTLDNVSYNGNGRLIYAVLNGSSRSLNIKLIGESVFTNTGQAIAMGGDFYFVGEGKGASITLSGRWDQVRGNQITIDNCGVKAITTDKNENGSPVKCFLKMNVTNNGWLRAETAATGVSAIALYQPQITNLFLDPNMSILPEGTTKATGTDSEGVQATLFYTNGEPASVVFLGNEGNFVSMSGTTGDLQWELEELQNKVKIWKSGVGELELPSYRLTISGNGYMPDYEPIVDQSIGKSTYNTPWNTFETITELVVNEGVKSLGDNMFCSSATYLDKISLPESLTRIGRSALSSASFSSISLPENLESLGITALAWCNYLKSIVIPSKLTNMEISSFKGNNFEKCIVAEGNGKFDSRDGCNAIILTAANEVFIGTPATVIPASVKSIGKEAFNNNSNLISFVIPNHVTNIGERAFLLCFAMKEFVIGSGVTSIGEKAFQGCTKLADVYCYANPAKLDWTDFDNASNFMKEKATQFHVKAADLEAWQTKFPDINATFVGDLEDSGEVSDGDVDGDGEVTADDVASIANVIAGLITDDNIKAAADVNGDGKVDVADIVALVNKLLGK